jgi:hypothetical protein
MWMLFKSEHFSKIIKFKVKIKQNIEKENKAKNRENRKREKKNKWAQTT